MAGMITRKIGSHTLQFSRHGDQWMVLLYDALRLAHKLSGQDRMSIARRERAHDRTIGVILEGRGTRKEPAIHVERAVEILEEFTACGMAGKRVVADFQKALAEVQAAGREAA